MQDYKQLDSMKQMFYLQGFDQRETFWLTGKENGVFESDDKLDISEVNRVSEIIG